MSARQYRKKQTGTLGLGILAGLGMTLALYGCPSMSDLTPPPRVDGGMSTGPMDASTHAPQPDMVTASDMSVGCQIGQRDTGTGCVCDVSSCVCGTCVGNQCQPRTLASGQMIPRAIVLDSAKLKDAKTGALAKSFAKLGLGSALIIDGATLDEGFARAARNLPGIDVLPQQGANVYDIMRRDTLVLTRDAVQALEARLK